MSGGTDPPGEHSWWCSIPEPLRTRSQWVLTRNKKPIKPENGWNDSDNQYSFQRARRLAEQYGGEPAYVLHADDPFVVIDLDDVGPAEPTKVSEEAGEIVQRLGTYTEASRSGTGLHLVCEGTQLPDRSVKGNLSDRGSIEVYDSSQYVVLTGNQIGPYDTVRDGNQTGDDVGDALSDIQREYLPTRSDTTGPMAKQSQFDLESVSRNTVSIRAEDVRRTLEEYVKDGRPEAQRALNRWDSPADTDCGFPSASEADMAFVADLAFWCREDARLMDNCFRASNRMREKWDEVHYADGRSYGDGTIQTAIRTNYDTFDGHYVQHR